MKSSAGIGLLVATALGLAIVLWVFRSVGIEGVAEAVRRLGWGRAVLYALYSLCVFLLLGAAWLTVAPGEPASRVGLFTWARLVREATADLLPFSQLGGLVVGARTLVRQGVPAARVYASMIADLTTELASQLLFTLFGLTVMASVLFGGHAAALRSAAFGGTAALALIIVLFILGQRPLIGLAARLARRLLPSAVLAIDAIDGELDRAYGRRGHVALSFLLNLVGWIASAAGSWLLLHMIDVPMPILAVLGIESLIFATRSAAFAVPGALGFQEAAYVLVGPSLGLPAETALALSIVKRARDLAIGIPTLLIWQIIEVRSSFRRRTGNATL